MLQQLGNASKKLPTVAARFERKLAVRRVSAFQLFYHINLTLIYIVKAEFGLEII